MATLPSFITFSAGSILTAAQLNNFSIAGNFFLSWPLCESRQTLAQSIINGVAVPILLDTDDVDPDGWHSTVTNTSRITPATPGRVQIAGGIGYAINATGQRFTEIRVNGATTPPSGSTIVNADAGSQPTRMAMRTITVFVNGSTDYYELMAVQTSGGSLNTVVAAGDQSYLSNRLIGTL